MERSFPTSSSFHRFWDRNPTQQDKRWSQSVMVDWSPSGRRRRHSADAVNADARSADNVRENFVDVDTNTNTLCYDDLENNCKGRHEDSVDMTSFPGCDSPIDDCKRMSDLDKDFKKAVNYLQALTSSYCKRYQRFC